MDYRKAVEEARRELLKKLLLTEEEAEKLAEEIVKKIQKELKPDLSNLDQLIDQYLEDYTNTLSDKLFSSVKKAAEIGIVRELPSLFTSPEEQKESLTSKVAEEIINFKYPDGLNLSERVWNWKEETKRGLKKALLNQARIRASAQKIAYELQHTLEQIEKKKFTVKLARQQLPKLVKKLKTTALLSISNGGDLTEWRKVVKQAERYIERLTDNIQYGMKPAYKKLIEELTRAIEERSEKAVHEAVKWWLYDKQLYRFKVITRTEMSDAYHRSVIESTKNNPLVIGYRWTLSRSHKIRDICDDLAHKDHGLGLPGIFPKDKVPHIKSLASHPQCLCYIVPVRASEVKGMDKVQRTQIQVRTILKDYHNMFSQIQTPEDLVVSFRNLFPTSKEYWRHVRKHAIPASVIEELSLDSWKAVKAKSAKLKPYQINYALQFLDTLAYLSNVAHVTLPNDPKGRIILFSHKKRLAVIIEPSGKVASLYELDKIKNWGEWKVQEISRGGTVLEVPVDKEIREISKSVQDVLRRLTRRFSSRQGFSRRR